MSLNGNNELPIRPGAYTPGELVDIMISGARVVEPNASSAVLFDVHPDWRMMIDTGCPNVSVTRRAPAEWPPQPADVWTTASGETIVALGDLNGAVEMHRSTDKTDSWYDPEEALYEFGPMRLEYRPGWSPTPEVADEPAEVDKRSALIAGGRALLNFLEANPNLPKPYGLSAQCNPGSEEELRALTERYGATIGCDDDKRVWSQVKFGPAAFTFYFSKPQPAAAIDVPSVDDYETATAADSVARGKLQIVISDGSNGLAGLPALAPVDEPAPLDDDRCTSTLPGEFAPGEHRCELYGAHTDEDHTCLCGTRWPNALRGSYDPVTGLTGGGYVDDDRPVPAPRDAAE